MCQKYDHWHHTAPAASKKERHMQEDMSVSGVTVQGDR